MSRVITQVVLDSSTIDGLTVSADIRGNLFVLHHGAANKKFTLQIDLNSSMKTRTIRVVAFCLLALSAGFGLNSCNPPLESPSVGTADFSSIRIMNFAECDRPFDLFIYKEGSRDTVINRALPYGVGSAYATNLLPGTYTVQLTHLNRRDAILQTIFVTVGNRAQKTVILWKDGPEAYTLKEEAPDHVGGADASMVYIRFLNTKQSVGNVRFTLDNPLNDPTFPDVAPRQLTGYVSLKHALDTTYAIYLTKPEGVDGGKYQIVSRLAGASFAPGGFYTVVFGGNDNNCRDTSAEKADTLRIRYFDDNEAGNELTFPVQQSLRFNFVNGLVTPAILAENQRNYEKVGIVLNNDDRYLIPEMVAKQISPVLEVIDAGNTEREMFKTGFHTVAWTDAILVTMYKKDGLTGQSRGTKLVDARVGNRKQVQSDQPFSIIICDTVNNTISNGFPAIDSSKVRTFSVPLPVVAAPDSVTLVLVNGLARFKIQPPTAGTQSKFTVNGVTPSFWNTPQAQEKYSYYSLPAPVGGAIDVSVLAEIGRTEVVNSITKSFRAEAGGVYEIVLVGQRQNTTSYGSPEVKVLYTNPKRPQ